MTLARKLKNMNLFLNGGGMLGVVSEVTLPKITEKNESSRYSGMLGEVDFFMGVDKLELTYKAGGLFHEGIANFGNAKLGSDMLRWSGAVQNGNTGEVSAYEAITRGRHTEIDLGTAKVGEGGETAMKVTCTYYKLTVDGVDVIEIDMISGLLITGGVDRTAEIRAIIGS